MIKIYLGHTNNMWLSAVPALRSWSGGRLCPKQMVLCPNPGVDQLLPDMAQYGICIQRWDMSHWRVLGPTMLFGIIFFFRVTLGWNALIYLTSCYESNDQIQEREHVNARFYPRCNESGCGLLKSDGLRCAWKCQELCAHVCQGLYLLL